MTTTAPAADARAAQTTAGPARRPFAAMPRPRRRPARWALRAAANGAFLMALVPALLLARLLLPVVVRRLMKS